VKKVKVSIEFVFCKKNIYFNGIKKYKKSYYEIYFYKKAKNNFVS
jgi:hypothetical protein